MNELKKAFPYLLLNALASVFIPVGFAQGGLLSQSESILFGALIWILFTVTELLYATTRLTEEQKRDLALWSVQDNFEARLSNIRSAYRRILSGRRTAPDLFESFFDDRLAELERMMSRAAERGELDLDRSHVVSVDVLLASFRGEAKDVFRAVHLFRDNDFFFVWARQYFYRVYRLVQQGKIKKALRLMIYEDRNELEDPKSIRLMAFHAATKGYSYKVIQMSDFRSLVRDYRLDCPADFGIYGDKYVYRARANIIDGIEGDWLRQPPVVEAYIRFFDGCWNSPAASELKTINKKEKMALEDLFREDT